MRKWFVALLCLLLPFTASATILGVQQGGTGSSTLSGILIGNGINPVNTLTVGSGLTLTGTTLTSTGGGGTPGGLNLQVQYNNSGSFGGISGAVTNGTILNLTNPLLGGATLTTSVVNGVTLTAAGSATSYLNGTGAYSVPVGTTYTGVFPIQVSGTAISNLFSTTTNSGMTQGFQYVGSGGIFQTAASSSFFGFTPQPAGTYVTAVSVASTNGFAGSSSGGATPALTLSTTITGVLKGNGTAISAASNGTDFSLISALTCSAGQFFQQATAAGVFTCGTPAGSAFPFTPTNNFGVNTNATSTILSLFAGLNASSTSRIASSTFDVTGFVGIGTSTNDVAGSKFALAVSNSVASLGGLLISTWTNVTNAFRIVNAAGATVFNVDTTAANPFLGVGTTTPWGTLSAVGNGTNPIFAVASSSNTGLPNFMIDAKGYIVTSGAPPVTSACGTSPVISGNDIDWRVHIGSTLASSCTITFSQSRGTAINPPICVITQETGAALAVVASTTPTAVVISGGTFTSDWFTGHCEAYQ